ncbi:MAG: hypothetical protein HY280_11270 [Nitrospinae bacterium]|nr:hypothetical protein [Nitrospinota bacterium]
MTQNHSEIQRVNSSSENLAGIASELERMILKFKVEPNGNEARELGAHNY